MYAKIKIHSQKYRFSPFDVVMSRFVFDCLGLLRNDCWDPSFHNFYIRQPE